MFIYQVDYIHNLTYDSQNNGSILMKFGFAVNADRKVINKVV